MRIQFLGTAAAEGMPAVFCNCEACSRAKTSGGKNIRTRSQILVNGNVLLDFPPDTYFHAITHCLDLSAIKDLFITHAHPDHCSPMELIVRGSPYAHKMTEPVLNIHASKTVLDRIDSIIGAEFKIQARETVRMRAITPYESVRLAAPNGHDLTVTSLPAEHTVGEHCFIYLLEEKGATFLQFNDSGILPDEVYAFLKKRKVKIDAVAFDCTYGYFKKGKGRHMGFLDAQEERARMERFGILQKKCACILTHFSHNSGYMHDEMQAKVKDSGFLVAYDGMEIVL